VSGRIDPLSGQELESDGTVAGTPEGVRVWPVDGEYVVSWNHVWVEGTYPTVEAAVAATRGDQAPAADPALDALDELLDFFGYFAPGQPEIEKATAIIREALADRITPAEARTLLGWSDTLADFGVAVATGPERALIVDLGRIADRDEVTR